jgi:hypothetical protein
VETKSPNDLFQELSELNIGDYEVAVLLASYPKDADKPRFAHLNMGGKLPDAFLGTIGFVREHQLKTGDIIRLLPFQLDGQPDGDVVEYIDLSVEPYTLIKGQTDDLDRSPLGTDAFQFDVPFLQRTRFYAIVLRARGNSEDDPLCFLRLYQPLARKIGRSLTAKLSKERGYYDLAEPADVFAFDNQIDAIKVGSILFVFDKQRVDSMFGFSQALTTTVNTSMQQLAKSQIAIDDVDAFAEACRRDPRKAARLRSIAQKFATWPPYQQLDMQLITTFITKKNLKIQVKNGHLVFDAKTLWSTLRLLDDDYLLSELTGGFYEVNGKRSIP